MQAARIHSSEKQFSPHRPGLLTRRTRFHKKERAHLLDHFLRHFPAQVHLSDLIRSFFLSSAVVPVRPFALSSAVVPVHPFALPSAAVPIEAAIKKTVPAGQGAA